jgi:hypothetical protein
MNWIRDYVILIQRPDKKTLEIRPPFSMKCDIQKSTTASANQASVTLYNLRKDIRNGIYKDRYTISEYWQIRIYAGYKGKVLDLIFQGNIMQASSVKQNTDWITTLECFDGLYGIQNGVTAQTFGKNVDLSEVALGIINTMQNIEPGAMGSPVDGKTGPRGLSLIGNSKDMLDGIVEGKYFIDSERVNILDDDEVIIGKVPLLDEGRLFTSPKRGDTSLTVQTQLFPKVQLGLYTELRSISGIYNGQYKTIAFKHSITVSSAEAGDAITEITLYTGQKLFQEVARVRSTTAGA